MRVSLLLLVVSAALTHSAGAQRGSRGEAGGTQAPWSFRRTRSTGRRQRPQPATTGLHQGQGHLGRWYNSRPAGDDRTSVQQPDFSRKRAQTVRDGSALPSAMTILHPVPTPALPRSVPTVEMSGNTWAGKSCKC